MIRTEDESPVRFLRKRTVQHLLDQAINEPEIYDSLTSPDWDYRKNGHDIGSWYIGRTDPNFPKVGELKDTLSDSLCNSASDSTDSLRGLFDFQFTHTSTGS